MKAAVVRKPGQAPVYEDLADPVPEADEVLVSVTAAALSPLARTRASGTHYSSHDRFPFVAGVDGAGTLEDGRRVYFSLPRAPHGAMAERTVVPVSHLLPVPDDVDDLTAAAIALPGMSSWAALSERARLEPGETVLINGATGASGRLAVQVARHLGAGKVIATGRNQRSLATLEPLGVDALMPLDDDADTLERRFEQQFAAGVHVVVDYLWGSSAERLLLAAAKASAERVPIRFIQVGSASGADITLPGALLRSTSITLLGSGIGSVPFDRLLAAVGSVLAAANTAGFEVAANPVPLADLATAWLRNDGRTVFIPA